jgi:hypothetical protein
MTASELSGTPAPVTGASRGPIKHQTLQTFSRFVSVLPKLTPATDLGAPAVAAYARRDRVDVDEFLERQGPVLEPEQVGGHIADLASSTAPAGAYVPLPDGLSVLP